MLMVSNHISWLDIPVLHAARHCRFISKSDVKGWPLIGTLATAAGTLYIERTSRRDARRMVQSMEESLQRREIRSEEHTSELQSPCNLVCRLLLEKKKKHNNYAIPPHQHQRYHRHIPQHRPINPSLYRHRVRSNLLLRDTLPRPYLAH